MAAGLVLRLDAGTRSPFIFFDSEEEMKAKIKEWDFKYPYQSWVWNKEFQQWTASGYLLVGSRITSLLSCMSSPDTTETIPPSSRR